MITIDYAMWGWPQWVVFGWLVTSILLNLVNGNRLPFLRILISTEYAALLFVIYYGGFFS